MIEEARYDAKLKSYLYVTSFLWLVITIVGLVLIPIWIVVGWWWATRHYDSLSCVLTERSLLIKKGVIFRSETTIPLDKIQDVSLHEGPVLRKLGIAQIKIETAGQRAAQGSSEGTLVGIVDSPAFRDRILQQRDHVVEGRDGERSSDAGGTPADEVLVDIRDSLLRIEQHLKQQDTTVSRS